METSSNFIKLSITLCSKDEDLLGLGLKTDEQPGVAYIRKDMIVTVRNAKDDEHKQGGCVVHTVDGQDFWVDESIEQVFELMMLK